MVVEEKQLSGTETDLVLSIDFWVESIKKMATKKHCLKKYPHTNEKETGCNKSILFCETFGYKDRVIFVSIFTIRKIRKFSQVKKVGGFFIKFLLPSSPIAFRKSFTSEHKNPNCFCCCGCCYCCFETGTFYATQARLEFEILLPQPPKCWNYRYNPPCLAKSQF
jgi:hypothetical protein